MLYYGTYDDREDLEAIERKGMTCNDCVFSDKPITILGHWRLYCPEVDGYVSVNQSAENCTFFERSKESINEEREYILSEAEEGNYKAAEMARKNGWC